VADQLEDILPEEGVPLGEGDDARPQVQGLVDDPFDLLGIELPFALV